MCSYFFETEEVYSRKRTHMQDAPEICIKCFPPCGKCVQKRGGEEMNTNKWHWPCKEIGLPQSFTIAPPDGVFSAACIWCTHTAAHTMTACISGYIFCMLVMSAFSKKALKKFVSALRRNCKNSAGCILTHYVSFTVQSQYLNLSKVTTKDELDSLFKSADRGLFFP